MADMDEIHSLLNDDKMNEDLMSYTDSQIEYINDFNNNSYSSGQINFQTQQLVNKWVSWNDSWLAIPIKIKSSTANAYGEATQLCPKSLITSFLYGVLVQTSSGQTIINDTNTALISHVRSLVETTFQEYLSLGGEMFFYKDQQKMDVATTGPVNPTANKDENDGFKQRVISFKDTLKWNDSDKSFTTVLQIPLKYIHDFFARLDFPVINCNWNMSFLFNSYNNDTQFKPLVLASGDAPVITINPGATFPGSDVALSSCRLYYRSVKFAPSVAQRLAEKLKSGLVKSVDFRLSDYYKYPTTDLPAGTTISNYLISPSTIAPVRVWALGVATGSLTSAQGLSNYIGRLKNSNILVNNTRYYNNDIQTPKEAYEILKEQFLDQNESVLSYQDFLNAYALNCFDLSRLQSRLRDSNQSVSLQFLGTTVTDKLDLYFLIERRQKVLLKMSASEAQVIVGLNSQ